MTAMNISLPDDLRERMDGVSGVTWSQVAAKAFELEVNSRTMGKDNDMTAAIKRLKASRQKAEQVSRASGLEYGKKWAMNEAEWLELCELTDFIVDIGGLQEVLGRFGYDHADVVSLFGRDSRMYPPVTDAEVRGFIEGALLVLGEVNAQDHFDVLLA